MAGGQNPPPKSAQLQSAPSRTGAWDAGRLSRGRPAVRSGPAQRRSWHGRSAGPPLPPHCPPGRAQPTAVPRPGHRDDSKFSGWFIPSGPARPSPRPRRARRRRGAERILGANLASGRANAPAGRPRACAVANLSDAPARRARAEGGGSPREHERPVDTGISCCTIMCCHTILCC